MASPPLPTESEHFSPYRSDGKLYGFVCVVTGADTPVGAAVVTELAAHGAASIYATLSQPTTHPNPALPPLLSGLHTTHPSTQIIPYPYPTPTDHDTLHLIDEALNTYGRLDVWVCVSSYTGPRTIMATGPTDLQKSFESNVLGPFFALKYAPPAMRKCTPRGRYTNAVPKDGVYGSIIVVGSADAGLTTSSSTTAIAGVDSFAMPSPCWTMSSHAALGVVRSGVAVLRGSGIRVNCISAGRVDAASSGIPLDTGTSQAEHEHASTINSTTAKSNLDPTPNTNGGPYQTNKTPALDRPASPMEVGRVAGFLASGFSSYITGANLVVDGGMSVMGGLMVPV